MDGFLSFGPEFDALVPAGARLQRIDAAAQWSEGPVWLQAAGCLVWSDVVANRMLRWSPERGVEVFRSPSNFANGNYLDLQGRIVTCEHGRRCISRTEADGSVHVLVDKFDGDHRLNSPNDLVVKSDGTIWFTDPPYGILSNKEGYAAQSQINGCWVYRFDPASGELTVAAYDVQRPNGLAFSPDERTLYVADMSVVEFPTQGLRHLRAYDVVDGRRLAGGRMLAEVAPGIPDGFRVDARGRIFCSSEEGIQVFSPEGRKLGVILVPERVSNCAFGGPAWDTLYITATTSVYWLRLETVGAVQR
jgi:gluconolactonase